jgi:hypothetical protein
MCHLNLNNNTLWKKLIRYMMKGCDLVTIVLQLNWIIAKYIIVDNEGKEIHYCTGDVIFINMVYFNLTLLHSNCQFIIRDISEAKES